MFSASGLLRMKISVSTDVRAATYITALPRLSVLQISKFKQTSPSSVTSRIGLIIFCPKLGPQPMFHHLHPHAFQVICSVV